MKKTTASYYDHRPLVQKEENIAKALQQHEERIQSAATRR